MIACKPWRIGPLASVNDYHTSDFLISNLSYFVAGYLYATLVLWYPTCSIATAFACQPHLWSTENLDSTTEYMVMIFIHGGFNGLILTVLIVAWYAHKRSPLTTNSTTDRILPHSI